jgi:hypothetical protein
MTSQVIEDLKAQSTHEISMVYINKPVKKNWGVGGGVEERIFGRGFMAYTWSTRMTFVVWGRARIFPHAILSMMHTDA